MAHRAYVHGYDATESARLIAQARSVADALHQDTRYPAGTRVLEVGCGTGAQTVALARNSPDARIVAFDRNARSLAEAAARVADAGVTNVELHQAELFQAPFPERSFDHAFVCFVLEHLPDPVAALRSIRRLLKRRGSITVFEGDHGSVLFHPDSEAARRVIAAQCRLQQLAGGDARIGRTLFPLLKRAGFRGVRVEPRMIYADSSLPQVVDRFIEHTFTAMMEGVREQAIELGLLDATAFEEGLRGLRRTQAADGVFCYTFFKAVGFVA